MEKPCLCYNFSQLIKVFSMCNNHLILLHATTTSLELICSGPILLGERSYIRLGQLMTDLPH